MTLSLKNPDLLQMQAYINGAWVKADQSFDVLNPATGTKIASVTDCGVDETKQAIAAAQDAFPAWRDMSAKERGKILRRWHDLILDNQEDLAALMTAEQGKPLNESRGEIAYGASFVEFYAEEAKRAYGDIIPSTIEGAKMLVMKQPVGVCAAITPWNFPSAMITRKVAPALAAGCTIVLKPAEDTPLSALALTVLAEEAGIPKGVMNIVTTSNSRAVGQELCANPVVRKLSFTGSTAVGKILMKQCADTVKKLSLELGGNAPFIVFDDADLDAAVDGAVASKYRNAGQTCVCANRIFVQDGIYDAFAEAFTAKVRKLKVGNGAEDGVTVGPLINKAALKKAGAYVEDAVGKGAELRTGGTEHELGQTFFEPTVLTNVNQDMKFAQEEIFGPVAPLFRFKDEDDVIKQANSTQYGLAGYFYSRDIGRVWRVAEALEFGIVCANTGIFSTEVAPFGGVKESGFGREGSKYGLDEYLDIKYVCMKIV